MSNTYYTIFQPTEGLYKEKGSKFLSFAYPVQVEEDIKAILNQIQKEHHKARHICYAWILGKNAEQERANDAGEPSNTAGQPILNQIKSFKITNSLVVVVRYFGGVKLGTSGLRNAYKSAAKDALSKAHILEKEETNKIKVYFAYEDISQIMQIINANNITILDQSYYDQYSEVLIKINNKNYDQVLKLFEYWNIEILQN